MADLTTIRNALAAQITNKTGLRAEAQAGDQITPPVAVVLPGNPMISYADDMSGSVSINLVVLVIVGDAAPADAAQSQLDALLGIGAGESGSIPSAIAADPSLSGAVQWAQPVAVTAYGRVEWAGLPYWGGRVQVSVGAV